MKEKRAPARSSPARQKSVRVLVLAGLDPTGRAGLLADVETILSLGAVPLGIATALTAQGRSPRVVAVDPKLIELQLSAVLEAGPVHAVKLGMIPNRAALAVIARRLAALRVPVVIDPVTVSSKGVRLSSLRPDDFRRLTSSFSVLTPNRHEADVLHAVQGRTTTVVKSITAGTDEVRELGKPPVLLTGSELKRSPLHHRGTGCRFASALAVGLASGHTVTHAARGAKRLVRKFLAAPIIQQV